MLFFIQPRIPATYCSTHLNTSHVILYQGKQVRYVPVYMNLNTSHVILYHIDVQNTGDSARNLNTSHVILYQQ